MLDSGLFFSEEEFLELVRSSVAQFLGRANLLTHVAESVKIDLQRNK